MNKDIALQALDIAIKNGADAARVVLAEGISSSISVLNGELDRIQRSASTLLMISLFSEGKFGSFSTNRTELSELGSFIRNGIAAVRLLAPDPYRMLPDKGLYYQGGGIDLEQADPSFEGVSIEKKKEFLFSIAAEVDRSDSRIISVDSEYEDGLESEYFVDSNGFEAGDRQTMFSIYNECSVYGHEGAKPQNWWSDGSIFFDGLKRGCGYKSLKRTLAMIDAHNIRSGKYTAVVENTVSSKLVAPLISALSGAAIQQRNSFLTDSLGKKMFPETLSFFDEPHIIGAMGSRYYDGEGLATKPLEIISQGIVNTYFLSTYYSKKLSLPPTIDAPSAPCFKINSGLDRNGIIATVGKGILITGFNGGNCNGATGDFSYGVEGFYFENGLISHPIKEMNITGNILSLWNHIILIGNDPRDCSRWQIPTLAFNDIDFSGC